MVGSGALEGVKMVFSRVTVLKCCVHCENSGSRKFMVIMFTSSICDDLNSYPIEQKILYLKILV